ncbi:MAG: DUF1150 domain-containing protein [Methylobacterium frigidaeris]
MSSTAVTDRNAVIDPTALASLGEGHVAYVKAMRSEEVKRLFPQAPDLTPGVDLFALLSASGAPILLTDSRDAAIANAWAHDLQAVSVH